MARGAANSRMVLVSAPVPQPTSSQRAPTGTPSAATNSRATSRLHRPKYGSYASPPPQTSPRSPTGISPDGYTNAPVRPYDITPANPSQARLTPVASLAHDRLFTSC